MSLTCKKSCLLCQSAHMKGPIASKRAAGFGAILRSIFAPWSLTRVSWSPMKGSWIRASWLGFSEKAEITVPFTRKKTTVLLFTCLTHWGQVTHIWLRKSTIIGSDNGLSPGRGQAIIWTNAGILLIRSLETNCGEILTKIHTFSFKKMHMKMASGKWRPFCLYLNVLSHGEAVCYFIILLQ